MKKARPKNRPVKRRVPRAAQVAQAQRDDEHARRLFAIGRAVEALMELAGRDNVRRASAKMAAEQSLKALAAHVANGKLREVDFVSAPGTCAVEFSEYGAKGELLTESVIAELTALPAETQAQFAGKRKGDTFIVGETTVAVLRAWDVVTP